MHLITTWTYSLPSCLLAMSASYLHMDIPTTIKFVRHMFILSLQRHTLSHHVHGFILKKNGGQLEESGYWGRGMMVKDVRKFNK